MRRYPEKQQQTHAAYLNIMLEDQSEVLATSTDLSSRDHQAIITYDDNYIVILSNKRVIYRENLRYLAFFLSMKKHFLASLFGSTFLYSSFLLSMENFC